MYKKILDTSDISVNIAHHHNSLNGQDGSSGNIAALHSEEGQFKYQLAHWLQWQIYCDIYQSNKKMPW